MQTTTMASTTTTTTSRRYILRTKTVQVRTNDNRVVSLFYYSFDNVHGYDDDDDTKHHCCDQKEEETTPALARSRAVPQRPPPPVTVPPILRLVSRTRNNSSRSNSNSQTTVLLPSINTSMNNTSAAALLPNEVLLCMCSFLTHDDWLAVDSTCQRWNEIRRFLWLEEAKEEGRQPSMLSRSKTASPASSSSSLSVTRMPQMVLMSTTQRSQAASYRTAKHRMGTTWNKVHGFLSRRIVWNGPASERTMSNFVTRVVPPPWSLPSDFRASWQQYHNGEGENS